MSTIFKLIIEDDEGKTTVYPLVEGEVSIGRKEGNTIRLMERNVSRRHARLVCDPETVFLEDLDSYNGVRINGERIGSKHQVREGDLIEIGDYHLALRSADAIIEDTGEPTANLEADPEQATADAGWPAGTVPDFRLPNDLLSDAQLPKAAPGPTDPGAALASTAATLSDQPTLRPDRAAAPDPRAETDGLGSLPPFPSGGTAEPAELPARAQRAEALVREPVEAQATRQMNRGPAAVSDVPRLVCVSTQYAGQAYELDRSELIIGRVEDNDIVIEHRSVSRNHAKIHFDGRTHKIIDLQSANGILVNGEEYAMTNLRAGDMIDLGHVRFRFVPAGEAFEPTDEEAREMRANGVEPPSRDGRPEPAAPAFDLSTAATITDAPLSIHPTSPLVGTPGPDGRARPLDAEMTESTANVAPHRADDRSPTQMETAPRGVSMAPTAVIDATLPSGGEAEAENLEATYDVYEPPPRAAPHEGVSYRRTMWALIAALATIVGVLFVLLLGRGDAAFDRELEELVNQGSYEAAVEFYEAHEGAFANEVKASRLSGMAEGALRAAESAPAPEPNSEATAPPPPAPTADPEPGAALGVPEPNEPSRVEPPKPRRRAPRKRPSRAQKMESEGYQAINDNRLGEATRILDNCVQRYPNYPPCHRLLGVVSMQQRQTAAAVRSFERYLELAPDAEDAPRIRASLREVSAP